MRSTGNCRDSLLQTLRRDQLSPDRTDCARQGKVRWGTRGQGKRGGSRVIYYWVRPKDKILMVFIFKKNEQSNLTAEQVRKLGASILEDML